MSDHHTYLRLKALPGADGERWIEGIATTARQDRVGDVVMPQGARYELPLPLLFAHRHEEPVGTVVEASVSAAGIRVRAKLTKGVARADEVWSLVRDKALSLSIGFQSIRSTPMASGGVRFDEWSWHELSCVAVPANPDARVQIAKCAAYTTTAPVATPAADHAWLKQVEPQRAFESSLDCHYRRFDAAVSLLPHELRGQCDVTRASYDKGTLRLTDAEGQPLASIDFRAKAVHLGAEPPDTPKAAPLAQAAVTPAMLEAVATGIAQGIGRHVKALRDRIAELEAASTTTKAADDGALDEVADAALAHHARLEAVEQRLDAIEPLQMRFRGLWNGAMNYSKGDCVSDGQRVYYAVVPSEPGSDRPSRSGKWVLMFHGNNLRNPNHAQ